MATTYKSFTMTVRPLNGLKPDSEHYKALLAWLEKQPHCVAVREKEGEAMHLHAQIWSMDGWIKGNITKKLVKLGEKHIEGWDKSQARVQSSSKGIRIAYNDWATNYLLENDDKEGVEKGVILIDNPPDIQEPYYPSEDEQAAVKAAANAKDSLMHSWALLWEEYKKDFLVVDGVNYWIVHELRLLAVGRFCSHIWNGVKLKPTLRTSRDQKDFVQRLTAYIVGWAQDEDLLTVKDLEIAKQTIIDLKVDNG